MNAMIARWTPRVKQQARSLLMRLAPAGTWRQRVRFQLTRFVRSLLLPRRPKIVPPLPNLDDADDIARYLALFGLSTPTEGVGSSDRVYHWLDFHPHAWRMFPLATTPAQRAEFAAWLLVNFAEGPVDRLRTVEPTRSRQRLPSPPGPPGGEGSGVRGASLATNPSHLQQDNGFARDATPLTPTLSPGVLGERGPDTEDLLAFLRDLAVDPSRGIEPLYRRSPMWQRAVPNGLTSHWRELKSWLAAQYQITDSWLAAASAPTLPPARTPGVNLLAHFCYPSGLQVAALNTCEALHTAGWDVSCRDVPNNAAADLPTRRQYLGLHPHPITLVQIAPEPLGRNAYFMAGLAERPGAYRIGYWYWELDQVPRRWRRQKNWIHELWAPTRFVGDALRLTMPLRVVDMLPGVRMPPVVNVPRSRFGLPDDRYLFLFAFDMSSTCERKNPGAAIAAFRRAFSASDPVSLVIKVNRPWEDSAAFADLQKAAEPDRIILLGETLPAAEFYGLMNCCDAYISLHRSEGFGLSLAEAMALGKPTVATGYSGNLDFMNETNSLLVSYELATLRRSIKWYPRGTRWAEPYIEDAAAKMRWLLENPVAARAMAERGQTSVRELLSLEAAGERMAKRIIDIGAGMRDPV